MQCAGCKSQCRPARWRWSICWHVATAERGSPASRRARPPCTDP
jgi:hypothetical protein